MPRSMGNPYFRQSSSKPKKMFKKCFRELPANYTKYTNGGFEKSARPTKLLKKCFLARQPPGIVAYIMYNKTP